MTKSYLQINSSKPEIKEFIRDNKLYLVYLIKNKAIFKNHSSQKNKSPITYLKIVPIIINNKGARDT